MAPLQDCRDWHGSPAGNCGDGLLHTASSPKPWASRVCGTCVLARIRRLRIRRRQSNPWCAALWWRGTAWICVALLSLASLRGLAPGLCANLSPDSPVAPTRGTMAEVRPVAPCCVSALWATFVPMQGGKGAPGPAFPKRSCAFCTLTMALVEPLDPVILPLSSTWIAVASVALPAAPCAHGTPSTLLLRGPPGTFAVHA